MIDKVDRRIEYLIRQGYKEGFLVLLRHKGVTFEYFTKVIFSIFLCLFLKLLYYSTTSHNIQDPLICYNNYMSAFNYALLIIFWIFYNNYKNAFNYSQAY